MQTHRLFKLSVFSFSLVTGGAFLLGACGSSQTNNLAPPPRPPDPAQIVLAPIRVSRTSWNAPTAGTPTPTPTPPTPTRGRRPAASVTALTVDLATTVLTASNEPIRACYKGLLALSPQAGGSIVALMRVAPDGSVTDVEPIGTPDPSLLLMMPCVLNAVRALRFPAIRSATLVSYPFLLRSGEVGSTVAAQTTPQEVLRPRPGEVQVPNPEPITVRPWRPVLVPNANPVRALTRDMAAEATPDITSLVDTCYAAAMAMVPGVAGQFNFRIAVEPSGNVSRVEVLDQNTLAGPLRDCMQVLGRRLQFHSSGGGAVIAVDVTLTQSDAPASMPGAPGGTVPMMPGSAGAAPAMIGTPTPVGGAAPAGPLMPMSGPAR
jgi:hypothetical protein